MTKLIYYGHPDGNIDTIVLSPYLEDSIVTLKDNIQIHLEDITQDGELYLDGTWTPYFEKENDLDFIKYIYLLFEILELNEYVFPSKRSLNKHSPRSVETGVSWRETIQ
jgi:hypothetical protein